jgi:hypothetical protein
MNAPPLPALASGDPSTWDQALYAFLIDRGNRSGSKRTVESYGRMLWPLMPTGRSSWPCPRPSPQRHRRGWKNSVASSWNRSS